MAENKKSFVLYADLIHTVKKMPNEKAGELLKVILSYVNDENPVIDDMVVDLVFEPIKRQMKRDLDKWEDKLSKYSESGREGGLKSGEARRRKALENEAKRSNASKNEANEAVTVTVTVNDTVNDNINAHPLEEENWNSMPLAENVFDLPEIKIGSAKQLLKFTKQVDVSEEIISGMWEVFKIQNITGKKYYQDLEAIHSHFINWIKTQRFDDIKPISNGITQTSFNDHLKAAKKSLQHDTAN